MGVLRGVPLWALRIYKTYTSPLKGGGVTAISMYVYIYIYTHKGIHTQCLGFIGSRAICKALNK